MARTPSKRWDRFEQQVMKTIGARETIPAGEFVYFALSNFKRQHASFVRLVKTLPRYDENKDYHETQQYLGLFTDGRFIKLDDLLAALQQGGKK